MGRLYSLLYCFENSVRELIKDRLTDKYDLNWWQSGVTSGIRTQAETRQKSAMKNTWLEGQKKELLGFVGFGDLAKIIINEWNIFEDLIPSHHWLKQRMDELYAKP